VQCDRLAVHDQELVFNKRLQRCIGLRRCRVVRGRAMVLIGIHQYPVTILNGAALSADSASGNGDFVERQTIPSIAAFLMVSACRR